MNKKYYAIIPVFVPHVGCPHDCIFCNQKKITGVEKELGGKDVKKTIEEYLLTMDRENTYIELSFFGGSFTGIPLDYQLELLKVAKIALDEGKIDDIRLSTRPDYINAEILMNLKKHGVGVIELGVQSMDEDVLRIAERGHTSTDVINSTRLIRNFEFKLGLQMMVGLPGDDFEKDIFTAREIIKLKPDFVRVYPALVIRNTYMEFMYANQLYRPYSVDEAVEICKLLYREFTNEGIPIIRMGLQATEQINSGGEVVAGPFHPAFKELVESSLINDMMDYIIAENFADSKQIELWINSSDISKLYTQKKKFFYNKLKRYPTINVKVRQVDGIERMALSITDGKITRKMSVYQYLRLPS